MRKAAESSVCACTCRLPYSTRCGGRVEVGMDLAEFDYHLPQELIAQDPLPDRACSPMLVVHREEGRWEDRQFREFPSFLLAGDCLVLNDSRVFPARLFGQRAGVR